MTNQQRLFDLVRRSRVLAQVDLARETGLGSSTVSKLVRGLKSWGLVESAGKAAVQSGGGKPAEVLAVRDGAGDFVAAIVEPGSVRVGTVSLAGQVRSPGPGIPVPMDADTICDVLASEVASVESSSRILGIAVAVASIVDEAGSVLPSADFEFAVPRLGALLSERLGGQAVPVVVENDANCAAYHAYQAADSAPESVVALVFPESPRTVGSGVVISGNLYRGHRGSAGELLAPSVETEHPRSVRSIADAAETVLRFFDPELVAVCGEVDDSFARRLSFEPVHYPLVESILSGAAAIAAHRLIPILAEREEER